MARLVGGLLLAGTLAASRLLAADYAVLVSPETLRDPEWTKVVAALEAKHSGSQRIVLSNGLVQAMGPLAAIQPRWTCLVARPEEAGRETVATMQKITRALDEDPYTDTRWGILTGYSASNALVIAQRSESLTVRNVLSGTPIPLELCESGVWYSELESGVIGRREKGHEPSREKGPADSTAALVAGLNGEGADLFITSGHATEHDWQIGYAYRNGSFRCADGQIYGLDTHSQRHPVHSEHPRVYLPVGNCLMGHISGMDCMALAYMNSAGVTQMAGYTVPTWFGFAGWGMLDYFLNQPGRYTLTEAFIANQHALDHRAATLPDDDKDQRGLAFDRTVFAFYGDPAWEARLAAGPLRWQQELRREGDRLIFEVTPSAGASSFATMDGNGSQRGGRPLVAFYPQRYTKVNVVEGEEWKPYAGDDFLLVPLPASGHADKIRVVLAIGKD